LGQAQLWQHKQLVSPSELTRVDASLSERQAELLLIKAFLSVPLSVLVSSGEQKQTVRSGILPAVSEWRQPPSFTPVCSHADPSAQSTDFEAILCTKELAVLLGVSERTADRFVLSGEIEPRYGRSSLWRTQKYVRSRNEYRMNSSRIRQQQK
jgi:hypothetical protein